MLKHRRKNRGRGQTGYRIGDSGVLEGRETRRLSSPQSKAKVYARSIVKTYIEYDLHCLN